MKSIGAAFLVFALVLGGSVAGNPAAAAPLQAAAQKQHISKAVDFSARHRTRYHIRYAYRPYVRPYYLDRPYYYAPAPFVPFNFGYGLWPW